jgi:hypothetical protein
MAGADGRGWYSLAGDGRGTNEGGKAEDEDFGR